MIKDNLNTRFNERTASLRNFLIIIFKRKNLILSVFLFVVSIVTIGSFLIPPKFNASAKILVEREFDTEKTLLFRMNFSSWVDNYDWIKSEITIIKSYPVARQVVKDLGLNQPQNRNNAVKIEKKEDLQEKEIIKFQNNLQVKNSNQSNIINVSYNSKDPALAARTVNTVIDIYQKYRSKIYDKSDAFNFFEHQLKITDENLRKLEKRQSDYKHREKIISPQSQREILQAKLAEYEMRLTAVQTKRIGKETKLAVIKKQLQNSSELNIPSTEFSENPNRERYIAKLKGDLLEREIQKDRLLHHFKPEYEEIIELDRDIAAIKEKIQSEIQQIMEQEEITIQAFKAEEQALKSSIDKIYLEIGEFAQKEYELAQLNRGIDDKREVYSMFLKQREEARISLAKLEKGVKVKVISPAIVPMYPAKPSKKLLIASGIFLGLIGGLGLALLVEYFDHSIDTAEKLEKWVGIPVLGSVSELRIGGQNG